MRRRILFSLLCLSLCSYAQQGPPDIKTNKVNVHDFFKEKTDIPDPLSLRDPFKPPFIKGVVSKAKIVSGVLRDGVFTNAPRWEDISLGQITIKGVYVGENRRALASIGGSKGGVLLKEGMKLGRGGAEVKAILPGGVVIVEKIINIYDQEEYLETIIPISK